MTNRTVSIYSHSNTQNESESREKSWFLSFDTNVLLALAATKWRPAPPPTAVYSAHTRTHMHCAHTHTHTHPFAWGGMFICMYAIAYISTASSQAGKAHGTRNGGECGSSVCCHVMIFTTCASLCLCVFMLFMLPCGVDVRVRSACSQRIIYAIRAVPVPVCLLDDDNGTHAI